MDNNLDPNLMATATTPPQTIDITPDPDTEPVGTHLSDMAPTTSAPDPTTSTIITPTPEPTPTSIIPPTPEAPTNPLAEDPNLVRTID